ncbi:MAG: ANTAR domain-containing protein [Lachnospiraceae bacterium]|nr:ANTAR domain-containing protein [Lachnospiraceae bacterium]
MSYIVIAMPRREDALRLRQIITRTGLWEEIVTCSLGNEVIQAAEEKDVSLVITVRKLKDMEVEELASCLPSRIPMILMMKDPESMSFSTGIVPLELPFRTEKLILLLRKLLPDSRPARQSRKPRRSPGEQKIIDDAKALLMEKKDLSEPDAFRYIQKNSMDTGRTMVEAAHMILLLG